MALFYIEHNCGIYDQEYDCNRYSSFQSLNWILHNALILFPYMRGSPPLLPYINGAANLRRSCPKRMNAPRPFA